MKFYQSIKQLIIKLITKNKKSSFAIFGGNKICKSNDAHYSDSVKREQKPKKEQICKNREKWFDENWLFHEERP